MAEPCWSPAPRPGSAAPTALAARAARRRPSTPACATPRGLGRRDHAGRARRHRTRTHVAAPARARRSTALVNNAGIAVDRPARVPAARRAAPPARGQRDRPARRHPGVPARRCGAARGRIVNISSISGRVALPLYGPYAASKFALEALSDSLRRELRGTGRRRRSIEPGADRDADLGARARRRRRALAAMPPRRPRALRRARRDACARRRSSSRARADPPEAVARDRRHALTADSAAHPLRHRPRRPHPGAPRPRAARPRHGPTRAAVA